MVVSVRAALIDAAERLFAERGSDGVSLREITSAAGATNASAVQYHFGDRRGLVRAVLAKHEVEIDRGRTPRGVPVQDAGEVVGRRARRERLRGQLGLRGRGHPADRLVEVEVGRERVALRRGGEGTSERVRIAADLYNRPNPTFEPTSTAKGQDSISINRWRTLVEPLLSPEAVRLHRRFDAMRFTVSELARRGRTGRKDHRLFTSQLTDLVSALLSAPVSDATRRLLRR